MRGPRTSASLHLRRQGRAGPRRLADPAVGERLGRGPVDKPGQPGHRTEGRAPADDIRRRAERMLEQSEQTTRGRGRRRPRPRAAAASSSSAATRRSSTRAATPAWTCRWTCRRPVRRPARHWPSSPGRARTIPGVFGPLPRTLTPQEQAEIGDGCYELLLILAEAVDEAAARARTRPSRPSRGLQLLDQAAGLRSQPTPTYHRQRAECLARKGDEAGAVRERAAAGRLQPTTVLDHFLAGHEAYRRQDWKTALAEFETVLRMQPGHFWALCLSAIGRSMETNQPGMAKLGLSDCIEQRAPVRLAVHAPRHCLGTGGGPGPGGGQGRSRSRTARSRRPWRPSSTPPRPITARRSSCSQRTPNDELRYAVLVDRALMRFQRGRLDEAVADLRGGDPAQRAAIPCLRQPGPGPPAAEEVGRGGRAVHAGHRGCNPSWAPLYRGRAAVAAGARRPVAGASRGGLARPGGRDPVREAGQSGCWRATTPSAASCCAGTGVTRTPWRPAMRPCRSCPTSTRRTACG